MTLMAADNGDQMDTLSIDGNPPLAPPDDAYEVPKFQPRIDDSYVGGLDILTLHRVVAGQHPTDSRHESAASTR